MILMSLQWAKLGLILLGATARLLRWNYQIHRCDWSDSKRGGGVTVYVNNTLVCRRVRLLDSSIELEHRNKTTSIGTNNFIHCYLPPTKLKSCFCKFLDELMDISTSKYNKVIALGDFNIDLLAVNGSCRLSTIFRDVGMKQIMSSSTPTRVTRCSAALLDHVYMYVTHPERIIETLVLIYGLSDHYPVCFVHKFCGLKSPQTASRYHQISQLQEFWQGKFYLRPRYRSMVSDWCIPRC